MTGYIGGDVLSQLFPRYPDFHYRVLARTEEKDKQIKLQYPSVEIIHGDLSDVALLQQESAKADIIIRETTIPSPIDGLRKE